VIFVHVPPEPDPTIQLAATRQGQHPLAIMKGVATLPAITAELIKQGLAARYSSHNGWAGAAMLSQQSVRGMPGDIAALTSEAGIKPPAITVIGAVTGFCAYWLISPRTNCGSDESPESSSSLVLLLRTAAALRQVELTVSYSSKKGTPLVIPEDQNWSLTIF
jgi:hypothetical protein